MPVLIALLQISQHNGGIVKVRCKAFSRCGSDKVRLEAGWKLVEFDAPSPIAVPVVLALSGVGRCGDVTCVLHFVDATGALVLALCTLWYHDAVVRVVGWEGGIVRIGVERERWATPVGTFVTRHLQQNKIRCMVVNLDANFTPLQ